MKIGLLRAFGDNRRDFKTYLTYHMLTQWTSKRVPHTQLIEAV